MQANGDSGLSASLKLRFHFYKTVAYDTNQEAYRLSGGFGWCRANTLRFFRPPHKTACATNPCRWHVCHQKSVRDLVSWCFYLTFRYSYSGLQSVMQALTAIRYPSEHLVVYADTTKLLSHLIPPTHDSMLGNW